MFESPAKKPFNQTYKQELLTPRKAVSSGQMEVNMEVTTPNGHAGNITVNCRNGPEGTPIVAGWLKEETKRKYRLKYSKEPKIRKLVFKSKTGNNITLNERDSIDFEILEGGSISCL